MKSAVKLSFQPIGNLSLDAVALIIDEIYKNNKNIKVEFNDELTTLIGDYEEIMSTLTNEIVHTCTQRGIQEFSIKTIVKFEQ